MSLSDVLHGFPRLGEKGRVTSIWRLRDELLGGFCRRFSSVVFVGGFCRFKETAKVGRVAICPEAEEDGEQRGGRDTPLLDAVGHWKAV